MSDNKEDLCKHCPLIEKDAEAYDTCGEMACHLAEENRDSKQ